MLLSVFRDRRSPLPHPAAGRRRGAVMVEFAMVAPVLFMIVFAVFELGRALMVAQLLTAGARVGCRVGIIEGKSSSDVKSATNTYLQSVGITGDVATVLVNDVAVGSSDTLASAAANSEVTVKVVVDVAKVTWFPRATFLSGKSLTGQFTMRRE